VGVPAHRRGGEERRDYGNVKSSGAPALTPYARHIFNQLSSGPVFGCIRGPQERLRLHAGFGVLHSRYRFVSLGF
jgi:hypothetical protein